MKYLLAIVVLLVSCGSIPDEGIIQGKVHKPSFVMVNTTCVEGVCVTTPTIIPESWQLLVESCEGSPAVYDPDSCKFHRFNVKKDYWLAVEKGDTWTKPQKDNQ